MTFAVYVQNVVDISLFFEGVLLRDKFVENKELTITHRIINLADKSDIFFILCGY